jgi:hypothetical protein
MTSSSRPEAMREFRKDWLVVSIKKQTYHFLQELIFPGWDAEGAKGLFIPLRDICAPHWCPVKAFISDFFNQAMYLVD